MKIRLNLATSPQESNRAFATGAALIGTIGMLAMFALAWHAFTLWRSNTELRTQQAAIESDMIRLRAERADLESFFSRPETAQKEDRAAFLNGLIAERAFPWTKIFMDMERSLPAGVRVVSIEPRLVEDHLELRVTIGAIDDESKLKFLRALEDSSEFSMVEVLNETRSPRPTDADHIVLALQARYSAT